MEGLLTLSDSLLCKEEVLGQIIETSIAGVDVRIHFPQLPPFDEKDPQIGICNPLLPPTIAKTWKRGESPLEWGYPQSYPSGNSCVNLLAISVECDEDERTETARTLYAGIKTWVKSFADYLQLSSKQNTDRDKNIENESRGWLEILGLECVPGLVADTIFVTVPNTDSFVSEAQVDEALQFAASGKELHLEYQMLLSSYRARKECQNRQAIIDACSAVELCLEDYISRRVKELGFSPSCFLDKFKSLGDRIDLAKQLDNSFPKEDHQAIIVKPRNDIAHNREAYPSDETTDQLIACVERCLQHFFTEYY